MIKATSAAPAMNHRSWFIDQMADEHMLREAWYRVQRGGKTGGIDGMTVDAFRPDVERRLAQLGQALNTDTYVPSPVKRVQIPKPSGGWRTLGLPTIGDRIAQTAAALVLHERIGALFSDRSFAYRPFLGPRRAALYLRSRLASARWVVTADIEKFFDNVDHRIMADQLRTTGMDDAGVRLILKWLTAPAHDGNQRYQPIKGLPQGSPVAPILANLYLTGFDTTLEAEGFAHIRYADDFVVLAGDEAEARRALGYVSAYLGSRLRLAIKPAKTQIAEANEGFTFVGFRFARDTWTIPGESLARFQEGVEAILAQPDRHALMKVAKSHNDLVRGWRNYYHGNSGEMDRQLAELDAWRVCQCRAHLTRCEQDPDGAVVWFERLVEEINEVAPPDTYSHHEETASGPPDLPPDDLDRWRQGEGQHGEQTTRGGVFASTRQLHDAAIGRQQLPAIADDGWLRVPTFGSFVAKSAALLVVRRKKQVIFECPFDDVSCLTIEASGVALSTVVIEECARRGIPVAVCRLSGKPVARILPARSPLDATMVRRQFAASSGRSGTRLVQAILAAKLSNQRALLLYHSKYRGRSVAVRRRLLESAGTIAECARQIALLSDVPMRDARRPLFLAEAGAAAYYWQAFACLVPPGLGFKGRLHREADDVVNKALNYGYALLLSRVWVAVHRAGMEPTLGLLHTGRRRSAGLVFDLMEPFRQPVVDKAVLGLIGRGARLELNEKRELTLRTRALLQGAIARRLDRGRNSASGGLLHDIHRGTLGFRRALSDGTAYQPYRMTW
ncbi:MAG: CRISPR-associated endonuclease Cas1 [Vicinamibacterales bacterium]|jgi:group II intron reverse transcriptase/maturase/CRISPR-associated endonuclease Cas1